ncbi:hypothetical protein GGI24_003170 [Coemansia furcata]|nr:hypothetical protein GGI24_003170 [Coemansia furcata]
MNHFGAITVWWMIMYKPLYECLTNRQRYLDEWMRKLRQDGQQEAYHYDAGSLIGNTTLRGDFSYVQNKHESHRLTVLGVSEYDNKGTVTGKLSCDEAIIETDAIGDRLNSQAPSSQPESPVCSHNGDIELAIHRNNSYSNLVDTISSADEPPKRSIEISTARWPRPPPQVSSKKPWEKLGSVVDRFGAPATTSSPNVPKPYTPIINFPEPAATRPLRHTPTQDANHDGVFSANKRQLL